MFFFFQSKYPLLANTVPEKEPNRNVKGSFVEAYHQIICQWTTHLNPINDWQMRYRTVQLLAVNYVYVNHCNNLLNKHT